MATSYSTRLGNAPEEGIKAPVVAATVAPITLSGEQTVNSVAVVANDRVLVKSQTDNSENGIYRVQLGSWTRAKDFNNANDVINGVLILDASNSYLYQASFTGEWTPDTTDITFTLSSVSPATSVVEEGHVAIAGQTVFNLTTTTYVPGIVGSLTVYRKGVRVKKTNYTETDEDTVTFLNSNTIFDGDDFLFVVNESQAVSGTIAASNVTHISAATGAVATNAYAKFEETPTVGDFAPTGDGVSDDTVKLQAAWDGDKVLRLVAGKTYLISEPLTRDVSGMQILVIGGGTATLLASASFTGDYIVDMGNASVSRNGCRVSGVEFAEETGTSVTGMRWRRVNNTSFVDHCRFTTLLRGVELDELSLSNIITKNRFSGCTTNIELGDNGDGNSTKITHNYFNSGRIYLNNSMTEVEITHNTFDSNSTIFSDGASGVRGLFINNNRFEVSNSSYISITLGLCRGAKICNNFFAGNNQATHGIEFTSSGSAQAGIDVYHNWYEGLTTNFVVSSAPNDALSTYGNNTTVGSELAVPYDTNDRLTTFDNDVDISDGNFVGGFVLAGYNNSQINDITHAVNTTNKASRKLVLNTTTGIVMRAKGSSAGSDWVNLMNDGVGDITPA